MQLCKRACTYMSTPCVFLKVPRWIEDKFSQDNNERHMVVIMAQPAFHGRKALARNAAFKSENKHTNFVLLDIAPCHYHPAVWANQLFVPFLSCKLLIRRVGSSNWPGFVRPRLVRKKLTKSYCSTFRCYLINNVQL